MKMKATITFDRRFLDRKRKEQGIYPFWELKELLEEEFDAVVDLAEEDRFSAVVRRAQNELEAWLSSYVSEIGGSASDYRLECRDCGLMDSVQEEAAFMIGGEPLRQIVEEWGRMSEAIGIYHMEDVFLSQNYLFVINEGCGFTTALTILSRALDRMKVMEAPVSVFEMKIKEPVDLCDESPIKECERQIAEKSSCIIGLDITSWIAGLADSRFKKLIRLLNQNQGRNLYIFRIPYLEEDRLEKIADTLSYQTMIRTVIFEPVSRDGYVEYLSRAVERRGFELENGVKEAVKTRISDEKRAGFFCGFKSMDQIACEILYEKIKNPGPDCRITCGDVQGIMKHMTRDSRSGWQMLEELSGMAEVKRQIREIVETAKAEKEYAKHRKQNQPCFHMKFVGKPGTGKNTVGRILGRILKEEGILEKGDFYEINARQLCGRYVGETAPRTMAICRDAYGSILFIDEAYTLFEDESNVNDFGKEALITLMTEMENHRHEMIVILAGYRNQINYMLKANPGIKDRIPYTIEFPDYTREELCGIFLKDVGRLFLYDEGFAGRAKAFFDDIAEECYIKNDFGNARLARNLYERVVGKAMLRRRFSGDSQWRVTEDDFEAAASEPYFQSYLVQYRGKSMRYIKKILSESDELVEALARHVHDTWVEGRRLEGWTYGEERDDRNKKNPCMVPYEQLEEQEKEYDRKSAEATVRFLLENGYRIQKER